ncbi:MAG: hypothetical protein L6Q71_04035, partial [Planctomycetes bacterium]|nr:hypothetical protein [Planctomycetota bacterium]
KGDKQLLAIVALCAAVAAAWGIALVRRTSRDSAAFGGITITTIGLGVFVSCFVVGDLPEASLPPVMFAMLIWLGLGGVLLARFARNLSLMRVNEQGIVIEIPQGGKMPQL